MPRIPLTAPLRAQYANLFHTCTIATAHTAEVENLVDRLAHNQPRYTQAGQALSIPWHFVAVIHNMESSQDFTRHLHNGDPLTARTVHVPPGRPTTGEPPFTWEASAADALALRGLGPGIDWSLPGTLYQIEAYNGFGYRTYHPDILSPYLWSFSNHYGSGKYTADGTFSDTAISAQCGAAVLLRRMAERALITFPDHPQPAPNAAPLIAGYATHPPADSSILARAMALQNWLSSHAGIFLKADGICGPATSAAYRQVTGHYLPGDPRAINTTTQSAPTA